MSDEVDHDLGRLTGPFHTTNLDRDDGICQHEPKAAGVIDELRLAEPQRDDVVPPTDAGRFADFELKTLDVCCEQSRAEFQNLESRQCDDNSDGQVAAHAKAPASVYGRQQNHVV